MNKLSSFLTVNEKMLEKRLVKTTLKYYPYKYQAIKEHSYETEKRIKNVVDLLCPSFDDIVTGEVYEEIERLSENDFNMYMDLLKNLEWYCDKIKFKKWGI